MPPPIDPKSSARQRDAERTRAALLSAARTLFSTRGFANTGVREVAELAGVNSSLVGRYFGSKQGLFRAVLEEVLDLSPEDIEPPPTFGTRAPVDFLRGLGRREQTFILLLDLDRVLSTRELLGALAGATT